MTCKNCGSVLKEDQRFCTKCGASVAPNVQGSEEQQTAKQGQQAEMNMETINSYSPGQPKDYYQRPPVNQMPVMSDGPGIDGQEVWKNGYPEGGYIDESHIQNAEAENRKKSKKNMAILIAVIAGLILLGSVALGVAAGQRRERQAEIAAETNLMQTAMNEAKALSAKIDELYITEKSYLKSGLSQSSIDQLRTDWEDIKKEPDEKYAGKLDFDLEAHSSLLEKLKERIDTVEEKNNALKDVNALFDYDVLTGDELSMDLPVAPETTGTQIEELKELYAKETEDPFWSDINWSLTMAEAEYDLLESCRQYVEKLERQKGVDGEEYALVMSLVDELYDGKSKTELVDRLEALADADSELGQYIEEGFSSGPESGMEVEEFFELYMEPYMEYFYNVYPGSREEMEMFVEDKALVVKLVVPDLYVDNESEYDISEVIKEDAEYFEEVYLPIAEILREYVPDGVLLLRIFDANDRLIYTETY